MVEKNTYQNTTTSKPVIKDKASKVKEHTYQNAMPRKLAIKIRHTQLYQLLDTLTWW